MSLLDGKTPQQIQAFFEGPALTPPPDVESNFTNPKTLSTTFIILCTVSTVVTGLAVAMRFYTRYCLTRKLIIEDFVLLTGWLLSVIGVNTTIYQATSYSLGAHQWDIQFKDFVEYLRLFHYGILLFCVTMLLLRIAIIMQVLRHFVPTGARNFTFWASCVLIATNSVFWLALTLMEVFACRPMQKIWEPYLLGQCIDRHAYLIASSAMNLLSEMLIMFLPQRIIWNLSLSTKQKLELTPLFLVGTFTCICSTVRLWQTVYHWPTQDLSFYIADAVMLWTVPEIACSVLVPCLPSLPQFIRILRRRPISSRPASTMFQIPGSPNRLPEGRTNRSWSDRQQKTMPNPVISDLEYHELVMRTETTVASMEREDTGPWIQPPTTVYVTGGRGPTKTFSRPTTFSR